MLVDPGIMLLCMVLKALSHDQHGTYCSNPYTCRLSKLRWNTASSVPRLTPVPVLKQPTPLLPMPMAASGTSPHCTFILMSG